jgi:hypothetical protein
MSNRFATARLRVRGRRLLLALLVALMSIGSTGAAAALASNAGGAQKPRPATFGDCKNDNSGLHNGYVCEEEEEVEVPD